MQIQVVVLLLIAELVASFSGSRGGLLFTRSKSSLRSSDGEQIGSFWLYRALHRSILHVVLAQAYVIVFYSSGLALAGL
jgi:hypothetical protein